MYALHVYAAARFCLMPCSYIPQALDVNPVADAGAKALLAAAKKAKQLTFLSVRSNTIKDADLPGVIADQVAANRAGKDEL